MDSALLNYILKKKGITQEELAERLGFSRQSLSKRLNGTVDWTLNEVKETANILRLDEADVKAIFFANEVN